MDHTTLRPTHSTNDTGDGADPTGHDDREDMSVRADDSPAVPDEDRSAVAVRSSRDAARWAASGRLNAVSRLQVLGIVRRKDTDDGADLTELLEVLESTDLAGDDGTERLAAQAISLDALFTHLLVNALGARDVRHADMWMRHALKAQAQCRTTLQTVSDIKHPRTATFVRQANIAGGHQQVNNAAAPSEARAPARKTPPNPPTELTQDSADEPFTLDS